MNKPIAFIADLHLKHCDDALFDCFSRFIKQKAPAVARLYILGDFFDAWLGDDDKSALALRVQQQLRNCPTPIFIMAGNRDFLLGKRFAKAAHCTLLQEPERVDLYGRKALLMHGDALCSADKSHQIWRHISHSYLIKWLAMRIPLSWRQRIAQRLRAASQQRNQVKSAAIMDATPKAVAKIMQQHQVDLLIHGHTHRPAIHLMPAENEELKTPRHDHAEQPVSHQTSGHDSNGVRHNNHRPETAVYTGENDDLAPTSHNAEHASDCQTTRRDSSDVMHGKNRRKTGVYMGVNEDVEPIFNKAEHAASTPQKKVRIVLAAWHKQGNALLYHENGEYELIYFD